MISNHRRYVLSPAKINLFLQITGRRSDGYHELVSLMCPISLFDEISLQFDVQGIQTSCSDPHVPQNETNLAHRAASLFLGNLKISNGVDIAILKRIPVAAGLGGGSSNAASVLLGLNEYYGHPLSIEQLMSMALSLGADVPFFIFQKPAIVTGIGEKLEAYPDLRLGPILLIWPGFGVSTGKIYRKLNLRLTKCKKKLTESALKKQKFDAALHLCNDLEAVTASAYPEISSAKKLLLTHGARGALMSGSGPAVFGIFSDIHEAQSARDAISRNANWRVFLTDVVGGSSIARSHGRNEK